METKKRLEWLDAMRGFTMILVVAVHVSSKMNIDTKISSVQEMITLFRMPLFFFVSGFLAYKASTQWTGKVLGSSLLKKMRVQVIPTAVFLVAFMMFKYRHFYEHLLQALCKDRKEGYWFTWVLLLMFVAYYLFAFCEQRLQHIVRRRFMQWLPVVLLLIASLLLYESTYMPRVFTYPKSEWANITSFNCFAGYFCFFVMGNICRRYWTQAERLFDTKWFFPFVVFIAFICSIEFLTWHNMRLMWRNLPRTIDILCLMAIIIMSFRHYEHVFTKSTHVGHILQFIGTRTLDIYLIHYFFLPKMLNVGEWFKQNPGNIVIELLFTLAVSLAVVAFSCLTSSVLRTSPLLKKYLFGKG